MIDGDTGQHLEEWEIQGMQVIGLLGTAVPVVFFDDCLTVAQQQQAAEIQRVGSPAAEKVNYQRKYRRKQPEQRQGIQKTEQLPPPFSAPQRDNY